MCILWSLLRKLPCWKCAQSTTAASSSSRKFLFTHGDENCFIFKDCALDTGKLIICTICTIVHIVTKKVL